MDESTWTETGRCPKCETEFVMAIPKTGDDPMKMVAACDRCGVEKKVAKFYDYHLKHKRRTQAVADSQRAGQNRESKERLRQEKQEERKEKRDRTKKAWWAAREKVRRDDEAFREWRETDRTARLLDESAKGIARVNRNLIGLAIIIVLCATGVIGPCR